MKGKTGLTRGILILVVILFFFGLRIYSPTADIPPDISFSGSIYTDEGNQCHNSRSRVLYGEWYPDDWRISNYNPVVPYMKYLIFKIFGVGLVQERLVTFVFAFLSLLVFYFILKTYFDFRFAFFGILLMGINFFILMYNRIGTFETPMIFWMILCLFFIEKFRVTGRILFLSLAGASAFMSFIFKNIAGYFIPVPVLAVGLWLLFFSPTRGSHTVNRLKPFLTVLLGVILVFGLWMILFYLPNREWIMSVPGQYISNQVIPKTVDQAIANFFGFNWKEQFHKIPVVWVVSLLYIPVFVRRLAERRTDITELSFLLFFSSHTLFFMFMNHRPTRYLIPVIPAMIFMTLLFMKKITRPVGDRSRRPAVIQRIVIYFLDVTWLSLAANFCFLPLFDRYFRAIQIPPLSAGYFLYSALLVSGAYVLVSLFRRFRVPGKKSLFRSVSWGVVILVLVLSVAINGAHYLRWNRDKTHSVYNISRELGEKLDNAYIAGLTAPVAVLENRHRSLFLYPGFVNWGEDTFRRYPLTHALLASFNQEITNFFSRWPERMKQARLLRVYNVKDQFLHLYSFVDPFIKTVRRVGPGRFSLHIVNPGDRAVRTRVGRLFFFPDPSGDTGCRTGFVQEEKRYGFVLQPGENRVELEEELPRDPSPPSVLFYLESDDWPRVHRYQAEKFPKKVGINSRNPDASAGYTRTFYQKKHRAGFLSFGPFVPFSDGFIQVRFFLKPGQVRSRIKPVITLDIFSYRDKKACCSRVLKPADLVEDQYRSYSLGTILSGVRFLEFRVFVERRSDVDLDYMDVLYYQGYRLDFSEKERGLSILSPDSRQGGNVSEPQGE